MTTGRWPRLCPSSSARAAARGTARNLLEAKTEGLPDFWGEARQARLARAAPARGVRRIRLRPARAGDRRRAVRPRRGARAVRADGDRERGDRGGSARRTCRPGCCPAWPAARRSGPWRSAVTWPDGDRERRDRARAGTSPTCCSWPQGDDVLVVETAGGGVKTEVPANLDPTRRIARVTLTGAPATVLPGARGVLTDLARLLFAAEATGVAREVTEQASEYAKIREQFGRPIATFEAVKHHCANMLVAAEVATAAVWDAARAAPTATSSATRRRSPRRWPCPRLSQNAQLNIQVHGGIGFTWEHDAHLYLRRAAAIAGAHRRRGRRDRRDRPGPQRGPPGRRDRPAARGRGDPRLDPAGGGAPARPRRRRAEAGADRVRAADAALAQAMGPGRRAPWSNWSSSRSSPPPG